MPEMLLLIAAGLGACCAVIVIPVFEALFPTETSPMPMYPEGNGVKRDQGMGVPTMTPNARNHGLPIGSPVD